HFVLLFALPGFYYLLKAFDQNDNRLFFFAGLLMGVSFIMKQSGIFFILLSVIILLTFFLRKIINFKKITLFGNGILFPILTLILILLISGTFDKFWFWTYTYLTEYGTKITFSKGIENLSRELTSYFDTFPILIILFILGILFIVLSKNVTNYEKLNFLGFILFSFLTVVPGLYFRGHYFITFLPAFAFGISFLYHELKNHNKLFKHTHKVVGILVILGSAQLIYNQKSYLFQQSVNEISRNIYGINPFIESLPIAKYIQKNSSPTDKIAILGSEPQIYYYSDRLSATGYIYTYNLMEPHRYARQMQDEMIKEIENNNPKFIIYTTIPTSWLLNEKSNTYIFDWLLPHLSKYYAKVGIIEFTSQNEVKFAWDSEIDNFIATSRTQIQVFKRINQGIF
ncbi:MAG TPA: hypothetical protein PKD85_15795, partial [Saprospiraceae bacterium]|nr:hypothetical protein [Saprospiraceae bacterium]